MISSKGVISLGLAIICCVFLLACGGKSATPPPPKGPPVITTTTLPNAVVGVQYTTTVIATGGTGTFTWAIISGSLPAGLTFGTNSAIISGTPTGPAGDYPFTVQVTDQAQKTATQALVLHVQGVAMITPTVLPTGSVNVPYFNLDGTPVQLVATGGIAPYTWTITTGSLPAGLTLSTGGLISGTPTTNGPPATFTVQVTDSEPTPSIATAQFSITILTITTSSLPAATINQPYSATLTASGGSGKLSWCVVESSGQCDTGTGSLPPGLTLSATGVLAGTPTKLGTFPFTAKVQDSQKTPASTTANFAITVQFVITTTVLPQGTQNLPYSFTLLASGGTPPYSWTIASGSLPPGLTLDSGSGVISGTPTSAGTSSFTVNAQDSSSPPFMASAALTIIINPALTNAALTGNYAFTFNGYKNGSLVVMAGAFVAGGNGNITNGVLDYNDGTGEAFTSSCGNGSFTCPTPQKIVTAQSSYSITPNGLGTMTLVTDQGNTFNFHVAITSSGNGRLIQDNADPKLRGSGAIKLQTTGDFGVGSLQGNFVVNVFGADSGGSRYAAAGVYTQSNNQGDISTGQLDTDDGGTPAPATFRGTLFSTVDPGTGRGAAANFTFNSDHNDIYVYAYYVVNHNEAILISANPVVTPFDLTLWSSLRQVAPVGGFSNGTLIGTSLLQFNGADSGGTGQVTAGLFTADGKGSATFSYDQNVGGTTQQQSSKGTYSVDSATGRVALSAFSGAFGATPPVFYVRTSNLAVVVGTDPAVSSGTLEPQTGSPFTNATIVGPYTGGTLTPVTTSVTDGVTWLSSDGAGNMNGTEDTSGSGGPGSLPLTYTYQIDSTGRIVFTGNPGAVGYVISPTKMVLFPTTDVNPALSVLTGSSN